MSARQIPRKVFSIDVLLTVLTISGILYICWDDADIGRVKVAKWNGPPELRDIQQKNHNSPNDLIHSTVCPNGWKHGTTVFGSHNTSTPVCVSTDRNHQRMCMHSIGYEIKNVVPLCESRNEEQISLLVFDDLKLIFITIPFNDGRILWKNLPASNANNTVLKLDESNISFLHNMTSHFPGYRKFTMVRHPCTRLIAAWKFEEKFTLDSNTTSFESFIEGLLLNKYKETENGDRFQSQIEILFADDEQFTLDRLLLFETWHQSVNILKTVLMEGKSNSEMIFEPQSNYSDCKVMYTPKTWKTMTSYFAMDFCVLGYPHKMTEIDEVPRVIFTKQTLASRIKRCRQEHTLNELEVGNESLLSQLNATDEDKRCTIYTYFQKSSRASNTTANENDNMLAVWKNTWSSAGWIPRIISEEEATKHPKYHYFREQYSKLPTVNPKHYELACFMRYVAMVVVGGGWMSDYDVLPVNIQPCSSPWHNGSFTVYGRAVPALVSGTKEEYDRMAMLMANISWEVSAIFKTQDGRPHVSDMICIVDFIKRGFLISEDTLKSAANVFKVPFECSNSVMKQTSSVQENNGNSSTLPMGIHYSHNSLNVLKGAVVSGYLTGDKIQESNQHRFNLMENFHDFYVRKCI